MRQKPRRDRVLPIAEALYPGYDLLFLFDNATSHLIYAKDALRTTQMNKGDGGLQPFLRDGWFKIGDTMFSQEMSYLAEDPVTGQPKRVQKGIQRVLEERGLWPTAGLNLECPRPKCGPCQEAANCKICTKGTRCNSCKEKKVHSGTCGPKRVCDACQQRKARCRCIPKQRCPRCENMRKVKCADCEDLPPKCSSTSNGQSTPQFIQLVDLSFSTQIVVPAAYFPCNLTSWRSELRSRNGSRANMAAISYFTTRSSIVNLITLNFSGATASVTPERSVIIQ
jgi:hypothetical protein